MTTKYKISCLCGAINQEADSIAHDNTLQLQHDHFSRHSSGVLFTSYLPIANPEITDKLRSYSSSHSSPDITLYFCGTCGCQIFKRHMLSGQAVWAVATGVISDVTGDSWGNIERLKQYSANDTINGGATLWLHEIVEESDRESGKLAHTEANTPSGGPKDPPDIIQAACACGNVRFHITRPNTDSYKLHSNYPDLMYADKTCPDSLKVNPKKDKWWIQEGGKKYMAGTCACRSCRLATGFEIQMWAFVPRTNIFFLAEGNGILPLDFEELPEGILTTYKSSQGVFREFCRGCGATVFWHDTSRPDLIDVSVGLLMSEEGARAESWLSWWTDRVSFEEDAELGREGFPARMGRFLVTMLEKGLKESR